MHQPDELKTNDYLPWSRGRGEDVWQVLLTSCTGDIKTLQTPVDQEPSLVDCEFEYYRPLHFAVRENQLEVVKFLLDRGADPMCGGLGYQPAWRPHNPRNHQWVVTMARERGYQEVTELLEQALRERFQIRPEGEVIAEAVRNRDSAKVLQLLDEHADWREAADGFGSRPLHWAALTRQNELIEELLSRGADINAARPDGARPIDLARGDYHYRAYRDLPKDAPQSPDATVDLLLARGADYDISLAARRGDIDRVRRLLDENPDLVNAIPSSSGYYNGVPLRNAAEGGYLEIVNLLLERGADPNLPEMVAPQGGALYEAIARKHWEIVRLLLVHGADANAIVESSGSCFWRAKRDAAPPEIIRLLASHGGALSPELAMYNGDVETLATLLSVNSKLTIAPYLDVNNDALLALALHHQSDVLKQKFFTGAATIEKARELAAKGLDPTRPNWLEITPLHRFAMDGNIEMAQFCLEMGADIHTVDDEYGETPLGWAKRGGQTEMVQWLAKMVQ